MSKDQQPREATLYTRDDHRYKDPSKTDVRRVLEIAGLSAARAGKLVGLSERSVDSYRRGECTIPYAVWRMLLVYTRLASPQRMPKQQQEKAA